MPQNAIFGIPGDHELPPFHELEGNNLVPLVTLSHHPRWVLPPMRPRGDSLLMPHHRLPKHPKWLMRAIPFCLETPFPPALGDSVSSLVHGNS